MRKWGVLALIMWTAGCGVSSLGNTKDDDGPKVTVESGQLEGKTADGYRLFAGIPYAAPPTGDLRWQPPSAPVAWKGVREATSPGAACPQDELTLQANPGHLLPYLPQPKDEDCLTLNVWTPASGESGRPVMLWIHGGALLTGSGGSYSPIKLVTRGNIIVVTINYRLGALGFLNHPALSRDGRSFGLLDQQAALKWVQRNISAFGGDPAKVTVAGAAAGGLSVCVHLTSPAAVGLFRGAIMQSGPCLTAPVSKGEQSSIDYARKLGCPDQTVAAVCLRGLPAETLGKTVFLNWLLGGTIDAILPVGEGKAIPPALTSTLTTGLAIKVPVLIGSNHDEVTSPLSVIDLNAEQYPEKLHTGYGDRAGAIAAQYPPSKYRNDPGFALGQANTDGIFSCNIEAARKVLAPYAPVYAYELSDPDSAAPVVARLKNPKHKPLGSFHTAEIGLLFDTGDRSFTPAQQQLSDMMVRYWANFVATGDPNAAGLTTWPRYEPSTHDMLVLRPGGPTTSTKFAEQHQCAFWEELK